MTRRMKILRNTAIVLASLSLLLVVSLVMVVRTDWFREYVRQQIITATANGTGGKVELGSFAFTWMPMRAVINDFIIHGTEPEGAAPFVRVAQVEVQIRLFTSIKHLLDITYLRVDQPRVNVMVFADGRTNIPTPPAKVKSDKTPLDTLVDLSVGKFELGKGLLTFDSQTRPINVRGENMRAQLVFNALTQSYQGQLDMEPIYVVSGKQNPVKIAISLPVAIERDRIGLQNARVKTDLSELVINASVENLRDAKSDARINGYIALADLKALGDLPIQPSERNTPSVIQLEANASISGDVIRVSAVNASLGASGIQASGTLKDPQGGGELRFTGHLALEEIGRMAKLAQRPQGSVNINGIAKLDAANNYQVSGNIEAKRVSFTQGTQRFRDINLTSAVRLDPKRLDLDNLRLSALGGEFTGSAQLEEFSRYQLKGNLRRFDIQTLARTFGQSVPYDGAVSGPVQVVGDTKLSGTQSIVASARLSIAPGRRGIPVSGRLNAEYRGAGDEISISDSFIALPHTRLTLAGSVGRQLTLAMNTRDLNDLLAALPARSRPAIALNNGQASFNGQVTGSLSSPRITGHLAATRFTVEQRAFDSLGLDIAASKSGAAVSNGTLTRGMMQAQFQATAGLANWKPTPNQPLTAAANISNGDLADVLALAGRPSAGYSGTLSADAKVTGTIGNPQGTADVHARNGTIDGQPFDRIDTKVVMADQLITVPSAELVAGKARIQATAEFRHPRDSFASGRIAAQVKTENLNLSQVRALQQKLPQTSGEVQLSASLTGDLKRIQTEGPPQTEFEIIDVTADVSARDLQVEGQAYGNVTGTARTQGKAVNYDLTSDLAGSDLRVKGVTQLVREYPTVADATITNFPIERALALAKREDLNITGRLSAKAHFKGTASNPEGSAEIDLSKAVIQNEPIDRVRGRITYLADAIDVQQLEVTAGPSSVILTARYSHPAGNLRQGDVKFNVKSNGLDLARIQNLQLRRPGIGGKALIEAAGAATVRESDPKVLFSDLNANIAVNGITAEGRNFGDLKLTAKTAAQRLNFELTSNLAAASIQGSGNAGLSGDYPIDAKLSLRNIAWSNLEPLIRKRTSAQAAFELNTDAEVTVSGPLLKPDALRGTLQIPRLQLTTKPQAGRRETAIRIENQGPIAAQLDQGIVRIQNFRLAGANTDIQATGEIPLSTKSFDLNVKANTDLSVLQKVNNDIVSSGSIVLAAAVRGTMTKPLVNGQLELKNASFNYTEFPNGISNANGIVAFNGNSASIRNLTAESGGGRLTIGGFAAFRDTLRFSLRANAAGVRMRPQSGVSVVTTTNVNITGTTQASVVSGTVIIDRITYAPQSDFGSILYRAAPPVQTPKAPSALLDNMKLDIAVRTSSATSVQAAVAQNLQADADLRVRGTASSPGMLGRVSITEGKLVFFGSTYTVNSGTISFYNPLRIEPVLNLSLGTQAKGVDVVLNVTGPVDNMKLTYTSDPPLQFQEIVSLLASGKTPTSDPTLLANEPSQPAQSFQQMGESQIVSKAVADPIASRLERVFGISKLKIDPTFTGGSELPQARLTLQQQVTSQLTFTYVTALNDPNTQIIRAEWALNPRWSAVASRDQNGIVSLNFFYKKQFR